MIVGIGVDVVDVPRFAATLERTPRLLPRLFAPAERVLKPRSLAARYAAKEALIKALGGSDGVHWTDIEVASESSGRPVFSLSGQTADTIAGRGITALHLSMSHDAGLATAYVIAEAATAVPAPKSEDAASADPDAAARQAAPAAPDAVAEPPASVDPDTAAARAASPAPDRMTVPSASVPDTAREDTA